MDEDKDVIVDWDATLVANGSYLAVTNLEYETVPSGKVLNFIAS